MVRGLAGPIPIVLSVLIVTLLIVGVRIIFYNRSRASSLAMTRTKSHERFCHGHHSRVSSLRCFRFCKAFLENVIPMSVSINLAGVCPNHCKGDVMYTDTIYIAPSCHDALHTSCSRPRPSPANVKSCWGPQHIYGASTKTDWDGASFPHT